MYNNAIKIKRRSIFFLTGCIAITIKPYIVIKESFWSSSTENQKLVLLNHEDVHMKQQAKIGLVIYALCYIFNPSFRLNKEIEAYCTSEYKYITYQMGESKEFAINKIVDTLYGKAYLLPYSKEKIKIQIENYINR